MAIDIVFPLYDVLVESIFGSVGLAIVGVAIIIALILFITRTSTIFITYWMIFYFMIMGTLYVGALGLVFAFILGFALTAYNLIRILGREG